MASWATLFFRSVAALEEGSEEWVTKGMRCEEEPGRAKRKGQKGEGKVASPHQRKLLRRPLEHYWHWANVTPTIALPTRHHQLGR